MDSDHFSSSKLSTGANGAFFLVINYTDSHLMRVVPNINCLKLLFVLILYFFNIDVLDNYFQIDRLDRLIQTGIERAFPTFLLNFTCDMTVLRDISIGILSTRQLAILQYLNVNGWNWTLFFGLQRNIRDAVGCIGCWLHTSVLGNISVARGAL